MHPKRNQILLTISALLVCSVLSCLDTPPQPPLRENPWDPENPFPPRAPDSLRARVVSEVEILVTWRDRSGNESGFQVFEQIRPDTARVLAGEVIPDGTTLSLYGRPLGRDFAYFISAFNAAGASYLAGPILATTREAPPIAPDSLTARFITDSTIRLDWIDRSVVEAAFEVEESVGSPDGFRLLFSVPADSTWSEISPRRSSIRYFYRIRTVNEFGESLFSNIAISGE